MISYFLIDRVILGKIWGIYNVYGYLGNQRVRVWVEKLSSDIGTNIFSNCGYGDGYYSTLPIAIPKFKSLKYSSYGKNRATYNNIKTINLRKHRKRRWWKRRWWKSDMKSVFANRHVQLY
jgi:hypothetical protein